MTTSPYSARVSRQLAAERQKDDVRRAEAEVSRAARRKTFQAAADWLRVAVIGAIDRTVAASGGAIVIDRRDNLTAEAHDAYKNALVAFSVREVGGTAVADYEVFVAHGLVTVHKIRNHMRQNVVVPGFPGPQLAGVAPVELGAAIVRMAVDESKSFSR